MKLDWKKSASLLGRLAALSEEMEAARAALKEFLYANLTTHPAWKSRMLRGGDRPGLFSALMADPGLLPEDHQAQIPAEGLARTVADYIAGNDRQLH